MGKNNTRILMQFAVLFTISLLLKEATSIPICNIDTDDMEKCRQAVTGSSPPPPTTECCQVVKTADLNCVCGFKSYLPLLRIDPSKVAALLCTCGITSIPPACQA